MKLIERDINFLIIKNNRFDKHKEIESKYFYQ